MNENEETLKALALIAAELHIQNLISISKEKKFRIDYSYVSVEEIPKLVDQFMAYFAGGMFSENSKFKFPTERN